ncbi:hypothetical protein CRYUN_Cryun16bG0130100 [Craigia yunnanensis]
MIQAAVKLSRSAIALSWTPRVRHIPRTSSQPLRFLHDGINGPSANPVAVQMINYALSHSRSQKSDESYAQGMLILEQCLSTQASETEGQFAQNSIGTVLLAMSTLLYERGSFEEAIEKLHRVQDLTQSSLGVKVAAMEALVGLYLHLGQLLDKDDLKSIGGSKESVVARAKAVKGLVELVSGNLESAESSFKGLQDSEDWNGTAALSCGEFLHATQNFSLAKELYQKIIEGVPKNEDFGDINGLAVSSMLQMKFCLLQPLPWGNLSRTSGSNHPKVGVLIVHSSHVSEQSKTRAFKFSSNSRGHNFHLVYLILALLH